MGLHKRLTALRRDRPGLFYVLRLYYLGCVVLIVSFGLLALLFLPASLGVYSNRELQQSLEQTFKALDGQLGTIYDNYKNLYLSADMSKLLHADAYSSEIDVEVTNLFQASINYSDCVDTVYIVSNGLGMVFSNEGVTSTFSGFYDQEAINQLRNYNPGKDDIFIPRTTTYTRINSPQTFHYITLFLTRQDAQGQNDGGLVVNIDEQKLYNLITLDTDRAKNLYLINNGGQILLQSDSARLGKSIQNTGVYHGLNIRDVSTRIVAPYSSQFFDTPVDVTGIRSPVLGYYFLYIHPKYSLDSPGITYILYIACVMLALLLAAPFLAYFVSRKIHAPVSNLASSLKKKLAAGMVADSAPSASGDVAYIEQTYDSLLGRIKKLNQDARQFSQVRIRETVIHLASGDYHTEEECRQRLDDAGILFLQPSSLVMVVSIDRFHTLMETMSPQDMFLNQYAAVNMAGELLGEFCTCVGAEQPMAMDHLLLILNYQETEGFRAWLTERIHALQDALTQHLKLSVSIGVGNPQESLLALRDSYQQALRAVAYRMVFGRQAVVFYNEIAPREAAGLEYPYDLENNITIALRIRSLEKAQSGIENFVKRVSAGNVEFASSALLQLFIALSRVLKTIWEDSNLQEEPYFRKLQEQFKACETLEEKYACLLNMVRRIVENRSAEVKDKKQEMIERACAYIQAHYTDPGLSIERVAAQVDISVSYFRSLFRELTGYAPADYLVNYRLGKAKELLRNSNRSVKSIAQAVGYDARYFYSVFKNRVGKTPTDYRKDPS